MGNPIVAQSGSARTAASALLSAADIWSTDNSRASTPAEIPQSKTTISETEKTETPALAETPDNIAETPDNKTTDPTALAEIPEPKRSDTPARTLRPSELLAEARFFSMIAKRASEPAPKANLVVQPQSWPPRKLSLALQGGGSFGAFT